MTFMTGAGPQSVAAADVNGDGKPDLIVANETDKTVTVLLNTAVPRRRADLCHAADLWHWNKSHLRHYG